MSITKIPFIALEAEIKRDEYNKIKIGDVRTSTVEVLNVVSRKNYSEKIHGLNFNTSKWTPQMKDKILLYERMYCPKNKT